MTRLLFIVEGETEAAFLQAFLPRAGIPAGQFQVFPHDGKPGVIAHFHRLICRLDDPEARFIVLVDKDSRDCRQLKREILDLAQKECPAQVERLLVRIACRELEAWHLGDVDALRKAYPTTRDAKWRKIERRDPDPDIDRPPYPSVILRNLPDFTKRDAARKMGDILGRKWAENANGNRSASFRYFVSGVMKMRGE